MCKKTFVLCATHLQCFLNYLINCIHAIRITYTFLHRHLFVHIFIALNESALFPPLHVAYLHLGVHQTHKVVLAQQWFHTIQSLCLSLFYAKPVSRSFLQKRGQTYYLIVPITVTFIKKICSRCD